MIKKITATIAIAATLAFASITTAYADGPSAIQHPDSANIQGFMIGSSNGELGLTSDRQRPAEFRGDALGAQDSVQ